ncbi:MAG: hypothetical protein HFI34_09790 [Lachnospiraceae bacterium]|nr:hypothetical protein [Lachnospiraceae bacterium]
MFNIWLIEVAAKISSNQRKVTEINCPNCQKKCIDYLYIGDEESRVGYLQVWCNNCLNGINISRVKIPEGLKMISFEEDIDLENIIPKYHKITPNE